MNPVVLSWADRVKSITVSEPATPQNPVLPTPSPPFSPVSAPEKPTEHEKNSTKQSGNIPNTVTKPISSDPSLSLFVGNIPPGTSEDMIKEVFKSLSAKLQPANQFAITTVSLKSSGRIAFVEFVSSNDSKKALSATIEHPISIYNQELHVEERNPVSRGRGRGKRDDSRKPPR